MGILNVKQKVLYFCSLELLFFSRLNSFINLDHRGETIFNSTLSLTKRLDLGIKNSSQIHYCK